MQQPRWAEAMAASPGLPEPPAPVGAYQAVMIRGGLGFVSGQFPRSGESMITAKGAAFDVGQLKFAARLAALNVAAQILKALGSWDRFAGLCRVDGMIAAPPSFVDHAAVLDGASEAFVEFFGPDLGAHARSATSTPALPADAALELVVTFAVRGGG